MALNLKALQIAVTQLGVEEIPRGSNWGAPVQGYLKSVGIGFPAAWCMAFVYWCNEQAAKQLGIKNPLFKTGGVLNQWNKTPKTNKVAKNSPQTGDIFIMDYGHGLGHTGIVERVEGNILHTIEGNTNDTGSREGYEVCRKTRSTSQVVGYIRY